MLLDEINLFHHLHPVVVDYSVVMLYMSNIIFLICSLVL